MFSQSGLLGSYFRVVQEGSIEEGDEIEKIHSEENSMSIKDIIYFYISNETLKRSNFKNLKKNQIINIEKSLVYGQRISGHFTQGHVDTVAKIEKIKFVEKTWLIKLKILDKKFNKFLVEKASISVNGVSLTISKTFQSIFEINVIPHTLQLTNLKNLKINSLVNVELDILSKYMYKYSN